MKNSLDRRSFRNWCLGHATQVQDIYYGNMYKELLLANCISTITVLLGRRILDEAGAFDESLNLGEDYDLWLRVGRSHPVIYVDRACVIDGVPAVGEGRDCGEVGIDCRIKVRKVG